MKMDPVAGDIDNHTQLEQEHAGRVEHGQGCQQTHCSTPRRVDH